ncbi:MAG: hypothetical protein FJ010_00515 [Chloroflexi bacterium]|nr:hypothetical protein [Chloroflexota bacterium]
MLSRMSIFHKRLRLQRGLLFGALIVTALLAFEVFNYSTTDFALSDLLGNLRFLGVRWATILSIAFCGIDFAGIARLFTPEQGRDEPAEVWYLFGAWMLAALMNAMLTWWGVSIAILNHQTLGNAVIAKDTLLKAAPVFVAIMVWLIRVLIIGTISVAGDRLFSQGNPTSGRRAVRQNTAPAQSFSRARPRNNPIGQTARARSPFSPAIKPTYTDPDSASQEPTYHPVSFDSHDGQEDRRFRF